MSADIMPCGCAGHADNEELCRYPALEKRVHDLEAVLRRIDAEMKAGHELMARAILADALRPAPRAGDGERIGDILERGGYLPAGAQP